MIIEKVVSVLVAVVYLSLTAAGAALIRQRINSCDATREASVRGWYIDDDRVAYRATATLPAGHRLVDADLAEPEQLPANLRPLLPKRKDVVGHYLKRSVRLGCPVILGYTQETMPLIVSPPGQVAMAVPLTGKFLRESVRPGDLLVLTKDLLGQEKEHKELSMSGHVLGVLCEGTSCSAIVSFEKPAPRIKDFNRAVFTRSLR